MGSEKLIFYADKSLRNIYILMLICAIAIICFLTTKMNISILVFAVFFIALIFELINGSTIIRIELDETVIRIYYKKQFRLNVLKFNLDDANVGFVKKIGARGTINSVFRISDNDNVIDIEPGLGGWSEKTLIVIMNNVKKTRM